MLDKFFPYRFELFLITQLIILFGSIFISAEWFDLWVMPFFLLSNLFAGIILVLNRKGLSRLLLLLFFLSLTLLVLNLINKESSDTTNYFKFGAYFLFYAVVTLEIIRQVWQSKVVQKNVILGLISGYISLGLLSFFTCLTIEIIYPNSYSGLNPSLEISDQLMYYAYITLMTIGYGHILPITPIAQKAAILIGLIGQFYLVILTAIVVGKYLSQHTNNR